MCEMETRQGGTALSIPRLWSVRVALFVVMLATSADVALARQHVDAIDGLEPITVGHRTSVTSEILGVDRPIQIYTPQGYGASSNAYPVLYLLDGQSHFFHGAGVTQFLARARRIPEMIVVGVGNISGENGRTHNMTPQVTSANAPPNVGGGSDFLRFLRDELQPWMGSHYRTMPYQVLVGHSLGGLFATQVLIEDPEAFQGYISISPSLWWDDGKFVEGAAAIFEGRPDLQGALYMTMGDEGGGMLASAWSLTSILETQAPESFRWKWTHMPGETHGSVPHRSLYDGLEWIFDDWMLTDIESLVELEGDGGWRAVNRHYAALSERVGTAVPIPEDVVDQLGLQLARQRRLDEAHRVLQRSVQLYPGSGRAFNHLADVLRILCRREEATTHYTTAYEMAQEGNFPNLASYRMELDRVTSEIESGRACTVPGTRTAIEVSEGVLATYVGEYEIRPGLTLRVTREGNALFVQLSGPTPRRIYAESETKFFLREIDAQVSFIKDESGDVVEAVVHQSGGEQRARRIR